MLSANYLTYLAAATCYRAGHRSPHPIINRLIQPETALMLNCLNSGGKSYYVLRTALAIGADDVIQDILQQIIRKMPKTAAYTACYGEIYYGAHHKIVRAIIGLASEGRINEVNMILNSIPVEQKLLVSVPIRELPAEYITPQLLSLIASRYHVVEHEYLLDDLISRPNLANKGELVVDMIRHLVTNYQYEDRLIVNSEDLAQLNPTHIDELMALQEEFQDFDLVWDYLGYWLSFIKYHGEDAMIDEAKRRGLDPATLFNPHDIYTYHELFDDICKRRLLNNLLATALHQLLANLERGCYPVNGKPVLPVVSIYRFYPETRIRIMRAVEGTDRIFIKCTFASFIMDASMWRRFYRECHSSASRVTFCHQLSKLYIYYHGEKYADRRRAFVQELSTEFISLLKGVNYQECLKGRFGRIHYLVLIDDLYQTSLIQRGDLLRLIRSVLMQGGSNSTIGLQETLFRLHPLLRLLSPDQVENVTEVVRRWTVAPITISGVALDMKQSAYDFPPDLWLKFCRSDYTAGLHYNDFNEIKYRYQLWSVN